MKDVMEPRHQGQVGIPYGRHLKHLAVQEFGSQVRRDPAVCAHGLVFRHRDAVARQRRCHVNSWCPITVLLQSRLCERTMRRDYAIRATRPELDYAPMRSSTGTGWLTP